MPRHVRKGDQVMVTSGSFKGTVGEVIRVIVDKDDKNSTLVVVKGVNLRVKHQKPTRLNPQGSKFTKEAALHISKVSPVVDGKPVRVGFKTEKNGTKVRVARHKGKEVGELGKLFDAGKKK
ncbi:MAG: 50S ribosomal protein L24 [Phycisphaerales bacterium]